MDTTGFFQYPTESELPAGLPGFLDQRGEDDWATLLAHTDTHLFRPGEVVIAAGEHDRALYLLVDGWLKAPSGVIHPITTVGEAAFLDGRPRAVTVRALTDGELLRLSYDGFEALAARDAALGREILLDVGRILAARLRAAGDKNLGWTG
jgi:CRP-like cAMP-binding protein